MARAARRCFGIRAFRFWMAGCYAAFVLVGISIVVFPPEPAVGVLPEWVDVCMGLIGVIAGVGGVIAALRGRWRDERAALTLMLLVQAWLTVMTVIVLIADAHDVVWRLGLEENTLTLLLIGRLVFIRQVGGNVDPAVIESRIKHAV